MKATLALETGRIFKGQSFGATGVTEGEVVFCTALTGYQEILTDPSYRRQIVVMTYPQIGNYGTHADWDESEKPHLAGFVAREFSRVASHWKPAQLLLNFMERHGVIGIENIDTRALVKVLRSQGVCRGIIATGDVDAQGLVEKAKASHSMVGADLVKEVTSEKSYVWREEGLVQKSQDVKRVVVMDFGVKRNILRSLFERGCEVTVVPAGTAAKDILALKPDGIMLSNGPGDPSAVGYAVKTIRDLVAYNQDKRLPIFGICLGHQLLAQALGGKTFKLPFGHRGANHPVKDLTTDQVELTTQNHGFAVDIDSLPGQNVELTHINLNDDTLEGLRHKELPIFSVQHHPEAFPGPHDSYYLFDRFINLIREKN